MMMMLRTFIIWYTLYDDNACDNDVHSMKLMDSYTILWWCSPMCYDVYLILMMDTQCTMRWWWCIPYDDDAYLWWWCMAMHALCSVEAKKDYLFSYCVWQDVQGCIGVVYGSRMTCWYTRMIWQWLECRGYQQQIQSLVCERSTSLVFKFL